MGNLAECWMGRMKINHWLVDKRTDDPDDQRLVALKWGAGYIAVSWAGCKIEEDKGYHIQNYHWAVADRTGEVVCTRDDNIMGFATGKSTWRAVQAVLEWLMADIEGYFWLYYREESSFSPQVREWATERVDELGELLRQIYDPRCIIE